MRERGYLRAAPFHGTKKVPWDSPMVLLFHGARGRQGGKEGFLSAPDLYRYLLLWYYTATLYFMPPRTEKRCDKQSSF